MKEKDRQRQIEMQEARPNGQKDDGAHEEEEQDNDEEPDDTRQTPENGSSCESLFFSSNI